MDEATFTVALDRAVAGCEARFHAELKQRAIDVGGELALSRADADRILRRWHGQLQAALAELATERALNQLCAGLDGLADVEHVEASIRAWILDTVGPRLRDIGTH